MPTTVANVTGGSIDVTYNGSSPAVALRGNGTAVVLSAPRSRSLGAATPGESGKSVAIAVSNRNKVPVTLGTATLGGTDAASFKITNDSCSGQALAAKGKCSAEVQFTPAQNASGPQNASLSLGFTYGSNNGSVSTNLSGRVR